MVEIQQELKRKIEIYSAVLLVWLVAVTLIRWRFTWDLIPLWLGGFFGLAIYGLDHLIYFFWQEPEPSLVEKLRGLVVARRFKEILAFLVETAPNRTRLVGHSVIFQGVLVVLAFFALSSTASLFGKGMAMGLFLYSLINQGSLLLNKKSLKSWFWQVEIKLSDNGEVFFYLSLVLIFLLFSWMLV